MTLAELKTSLESVDNNAFLNKVAYRAFPASAAPALPFICILETETDNFKADDKVYLKRQNVDIELYEGVKSPAVEEAIESMLNDNEIVWDKYENYIDAENTIQVIYEVVI